MYTLLYSKKGRGLRAGQCAGGPRTSSVAPFLKISSLFSFDFFFRPLLIVIFTAFSADIYIFFFCQLTH